MSEPWDGAAMSKEEALARAEKRVMGEFRKNGITPRLIEIVRWWEHYLTRYEEKQ